MRPGEGKSHRGCAIRCIESGVPMGFKMERYDGVETIMLVQVNSGVNTEIYQSIVKNAGRPIHLEGAIYLVDDVAVFYPTSMVVLYYEAMFNR